ncbi:MAG: hypothetical protein QM800_07725 [Paludibacter sp.]
MLIIVSVCSGVSQEWNSARLSLLYGSSVPFNFTSLDKIKNGIEIVSATRYGISMADSSKVGHTLKGFELYFRAFNLQSNLKGDSYTLPLSTIRVKAENALGLESGESDDYQPLTSNWVRLFRYVSDPWVGNLDWANSQLNISFKCGTADTGSSLMGEPADYYNVEIEFELVPIGDGF